MQWPPPHAPLRHVGRQVINTQSKQVSLQSMQVLLKANWTKGDVLSHHYAPQGL
jgi:hypothetical protein